MKACVIPNAAQSTVKIDGDDWVFGYTIGALVEITERTRLGVNYQSENEFNFSGDLNISGGIVGGAGMDPCHTSFT